MSRHHLFIGLVAMLCLTGCLSSRKYKDIDYLTGGVENGERPTLNVFVPKKIEEGKAPVLLFVHGGNWNSGNKETYNILGRNFARKDVVTVIPGYTLSPDASYEEMAQQIAEAVRWTLDSIGKYKGDPQRVYLTGHSAGGHLVALVATNPDYDIDPDDIAGIILNDAAGLDMHHYLTNNPPTTNEHYLTTWTKYPEVWEEASPINYVDAASPPFMIYLGSKTYNSIKTANERFLKELKPHQPGITPIIIDKKHIPMVTQYVWPWNKRYDEILEFMEAQGEE
ncbi:alpha/beta hydrolase [Roseivirga sp. BDSF3-8]|uniref:alpha/beta hydrolase n=1 Tax=Roseivirga sp. BDSF3-8 TaxID=3241598 RepID=UPI0035319376